jgi:hypothetical protein
MSLDQLAHNAPDYSSAFTERVRAMRSRIQGELSLTLAHKDTMDYSSGQVLEHYDPGSHIRAQIWISSRAPLWTSVFMRSIAPNEWVQISEDEVPPPEQELVKSIGAILSSEGFGEVSASQQKEPLPGHFTELDSAPSTVFQHFFSEVV